MSIQIPNIVEYDATGRLIPSGLTTIATSGVSFPLLGPDGDATTPSYAFADEINTGFFRVTASTIGMTLGGIEALDFASDGSGNITITNPNLGKAIGLTSDYCEIQTPTNIFVACDDTTPTGAIDLHSNESEVLFNDTDKTIEFNPGNVLSFKLDKSVAAGSTRMLIWDVNSGALQRVTVGAADSGGAGFKVLRIPN